MDFSARLLKWYGTHKRALPWRGNRDPYTVWLSEIILQQTRVAQGTPYFLRFREHFPNVESLARAGEEQVMKLWQGLGYYSRARNLHETARYVAFERGGMFPDTYEGLLTLKGVGPYTAAAIASICFDLPKAVVDGNVFRVLSRHFGVDVPVNTSAGKTYFSELANAVMDDSRPGEYNQAIMEFGALQCVPQNPDCKACPLQESCAALAGNRVQALPVKQPKAAPKKRFFHYLMPVDPDQCTLLRKRQGRGIWNGLYEFPLLEKQSTPTEEELSGCLDAAMGTSCPEVHRYERLNEEAVIHKLSHQHLHTTFWIAHTGRLPEGRIPIAGMDQYPVPVLISEFMETVKNSYF